MKTTIISAFLLATFATLGVCAPSVDVVGRDVATPASPPTPAKGFSGQVVVPEPPANVTVKYGPVTKKSSVKARGLETRQQLSLICEYPAPPAVYAEDTINYILSLNEVITLPAGYYIYWETVDAVAYFVNSYYTALTFGTTFLADNLQVIYIDCILNEGLSGELYQSSPLVYELGLELAGEPLPLF